MRTKKMVSGLLLLSLIAVLVCGFAVANAASQVTLTVWDFKYNDPGMHPVMVKIDELFMKKYPNVKISHVGQPNDQYYQLLRAAAQANDGPDVAMFHGARGDTYELDQFQVKLDKYIKPWRKEIPEDSWKVASTNRNFKNGIKLIPMTSQGFGFYYNKAYFKKAGLDPNKPPKDWNSFLAACEKLKAAGIVPITGGTRDYTANFMFRTFAANIFGKNVSGLQTGKLGFEKNAAFKKAAQMMVELKQKGYFDPNGASTPYFMDAINNYAAGKGAIFCGLLSDVANWKQFSDALGKNNVGYFPSINFTEAKSKDMQSFQPVGIGFGVMTWSKNKDLAEKYAEFYARGEGAQTFVAGTGALSPNTTLDAEALGYPVLKDISSYLKKNISEDYQTWFVGSFEDDLIAVTQRLLITGEINPDKFVEQVEKVAAQHR
ncbi:raffinose/stachyose/melibiose transport system substrate-binding protein [Hydrogenispora ethanolica]|uniref:Raffinose/stachyose/melibiose transport system substrate-binding protein n=1 Tax=Hydrogenispora ethanolica TaxID=1082276 RepID=A0A4R1RA01_HYDET|nr:extracellular solute-binding protein [Hydrogenispora ethanolica]TCL62535.1 raffinose/stachyose/melibiose transport system substrate-binding protein [Hydrogenispora ethanolica]